VDFQPFQLAFLITTGISYFSGLPSKKLKIGVAENPERVNLFPAFDTKREDL
jgi:hypothetical protein